MKQVIKQIAGTSLYCSYEIEQFDNGLFTLTVFVCFDPDQDKWHKAGFRLVFANTVENSTFDLVPVKYEPLTNIVLFSLEITN